MKTTDKLQNLIPVTSEPDLNYLLSSVRYSTAVVQYSCLHIEFFSANNNITIELKCG